MGDWYRVVKTIKGYRYLYDQRTRREGKHVRTENRYLGPLGDRGARAPSGEEATVTTTGAAPRLAYHGSREGIVGAPEPSASGTFGPGFYLAAQERAAGFATYDPKWAANPAAGLPAEPQHEGAVHAFDLSALKLKVLETWDAYFALVDELLEVDQGYATPADKARVQELLAAQGYDGIEVQEGREEIVVFPASLHKITMVPSSTLYRGGGQGAMPRGLTARDVVAYEREELGNRITVEPGVDLQAIPSERLVWLTETRAAAGAYGEVEAVELTDFRIVARDPYGGVLVERVTTTGVAGIEAARREGRQPLPRYTQRRREPLPGTRQSRMGGPGAVLREEAMHAPSLYATVTQSIVDELKAGTVPWVKPWKAGLGAGGAGCLPYNAATGRSYSGVNVLTLWAAAVRKGYPLPRWLTFNQAREAGGYVRKGEKGTAIVFTKQIEVEDDTGEREEARRRIPVLRTFAVFNVAQVDDLPEELYAVPEARPEGERFAAAEAFVAATGAEIRHGGDMAAYLPSPDTINMPPVGSFESAEHYYATEFHELGHWTGHEGRLARDLKNRFGSRAYAAEELIAELTAAFLCAERGIEGQLRHADYIGHWLELLENDQRAIFTAASRASQAAEYLKSFSAPPEAV